MRNETLFSREETLANMLELKIHNKDWLSFLLFKKKTLKLLGTINLYVLIESFGFFVLTNKLSRFKTLLFNSKTLIATGKKFCTFQVVIFAGYNMCNLVRTFLFFILKKIGDVLGNYVVYGLFYLV